MTEETSPIHDFYPQDFELDMNGKKQDWEAVVKIPFIDQARLLRAMSRKYYSSLYPVRLSDTLARDAQLTKEETERNRSGILSTQFEYDESQESNYSSSHPGFFPDIIKCHCKGTPFHLPTLGDGVNLILGLLDGAHLGVSTLAGFPTLQTLPHQGALGYHGVNVFQSDSRNQSMIITVTTKLDRGKSIANIAEKMIGHRTFHSWPYLHEGIISAVSDEMFKYERTPVGRTTKIVSTPHNPFQAIGWKKQADHTEHHHSKRFGIIIGNVDVILHVRPLKGEYPGHSHNPCSCH